uniref:Uncharacterized protein n=1 Tax=Avena sativa TaxID=4498 RepID=A0ACD5TNE9_AVESA
MARAVAMCAVLVLVVVVMVTPSASAARVPSGESMAEQQCVPGKLMVCSRALLGGEKPTESCCSNLKAQEGCFCMYAKNPLLSPYVNSPNASKTLTSCGITIPTCAK